jgi:hypothetical protein
MKAAVNLAESRISAWASSRAVQKKSAENAKAFLPRKELSLDMRLQICAGTVASSEAISGRNHLRTGRQRWNAGSTGDFLSSQTNYQFL